MMTYVVGAILVVAIAANEIRITKAHQKIQTMINDGWEDCREFAF